MKRWALFLLLLLSLGLNLGMLLPRLWFGAQEASVESSALEVARGTDEEVPLPRVFHKMADELHLVGDERQAFLGLQRIFFDRTREARARIALHQRAMRRELVGESPDRSQVDQLLEELSLAHADLERAFVINLLDTRELLSGPRERLFMHMMGRWWKARSADPSRRPAGRWQKENFNDPQTRRERLQRHRANPEGARTEEGG